jgi:trehalose 6-phosphate phosphatase
LENDVEHLLSAWPQITEKLKDSGHFLLLADYDGTLTPIVSRPELAELPEEMRHLLETLLHHNRFIIGIISGRALSDLKGKVRIEGMVYAGNHGLEIEGPGIRLVNPVANEMRPVLLIIYQLLSRTLRKIRGVIIENKGLTLSIHYRQVSEEKSREVKSIFDRIVSGAQALGKISITPGKKVYEVRPDVDWDKGKALRLLMKKYGKGGRNSKLVPIYLGDDRTDEDAFRAIEKYENGISVFIGEPTQETAARYFLKSSVEVADFFKILLKTTRRGTNEE